MASEEQIEECLPSQHMFSSWEWDWNSLHNYRVSTKAACKKCNLVIREYYSLIPERDTKPFTDALEKAREAIGQAFFEGYSAGAGKSVDWDTAQTKYRGSEAEQEAAEINRVLGRGE